MFNYDSVKLDLKVSENSVYRFSSSELHLLDLSLLGSLHSLSEQILWCRDHSACDEEFFDMVSKFDSLCSLYDLIFSESRGDDISKIVFDSVSRAKMFIFQVKKNRNLIKHSADDSRFNDVIKQEFGCETN